MAENVIECLGVSKRYAIGQHTGGGQTLREAITVALRRHPPTERSEVWPLRDFNLEVAEGEAIGIIGRNGAGKSTLLKILSRITPPTSGRVRTRGRVGSLLEVGTGFHPDLTGRENIQLNGAVLGMGRREVRRQFDAIVEFSGIRTFIDTPVKRYSSGMYLRLAFSVAAHLQADIMLVDEVLAVGDAEFQRRCLGKMAEVERAGRTVLFVSHNLDAVVRLCPRSIWLDRGSLRASGPTAEIVDAYLGDGVGQSGTRTWAPSSSPKAACLRRVSVLDVDDQPRALLDRGQPFVIEVEFTVDRPSPGLNLATVVSTNRGARVLDEAISDRADAPVAPGVHRARLTVPPILGVGDYRIAVWIGSAYEDFVWEEEALSFRLEGVTNGRADRLVQLEDAWDVI
jgi:ABC-2 type transport system ATP-binding protein/lipopolysaccharide transport system ATP-binding protein